MHTCPQYFRLLLFELLKEISSASKCHIFFFIVIYGIAPTMAKGKQDSKASDKNAGAKSAKGKGKGDSKEKDSKPTKGASSINVRHILVRPAHFVHPPPRGRFLK